MERIISWHIYMRILYTQNTIKSLTISDGGLDGVFIIFIIWLLIFAELTLTYFIDNRFKVSSRSDSY